MSDTFHYQDYVTDDAFLIKYNEWQRQFRTEARECDKVMIRMVAEALRASRKAKVLDIGCSTGNLLLHLRHAMPELELTGGELAESSLQVARENPELSGVRFEKMDIFEPLPSGFDIVISNAVLFMLTDEQFEVALRNIAGALVSGGTALFFDFFHPFESSVALLEKSDSHPDGMLMNFRRQSDVDKSLRGHGFDDISYHRFTLPMDMPGGGPGLPTYTVKTADGHRLPFHSVLYLPWHHASAVKRR